MLTQRHVNTVHGPVTFEYGPEADFAKGVHISENQAEKVIASAIRHPSGLVFSSIHKRHFHVIAAMDALGYAGLINTRDQGFLTSYGRYVDRKEAMVVVLAAHQTYNKSGGPDDELFSEDVW